MRTTVNLDEQLLREIKLVAAQNGTTVTAVIEDALRDALARRKRPAIHQPVRLTTFRGGGLQPGVDLDDSASLLDMMESATATP